MDFSSATPTSAPPPALPVTAPAVQLLIDKARNRFDKVTTLHFVLGVTGQIYLDPAHTQRLTAADGDLIRPDRFSLTASVAAGSLSAQLKFVQIADKSYLTNVLTNQWQAAPDGLSYDPRVLFDPDNGVTAIMARINNWTIADPMMVNGVMTQHLHGVSPSAAAASLVSDSLRGDYVDVDLYVESKNSDILRFILAEQPLATADASPPSKWTLDLSKQNDAITIDPPMIGALARR